MELNGLLVQHVHEGPVSGNKHVGSTACRLEHRLHLYNVSDPQTVELPPLTQRGHLWKTRFFTYGL